MVNKKELEAQKLEENALKLVKKSARRFAWNVDRSFAKLLLPIIEAYIKDADKSVDLAHLCMPKFIYNKVYVYPLKNPLYKKIKDYYYKKSMKQLYDVVEALQDILNEETESWEKKWGYKEFKPTEYDTISFTDEKGRKLTKWILKPEFKGNEKYNQKILKYNNSRFTKCDKWRKKQLYWLINNLRKLWW